MLDIKTAFLYREIKDQVFIEAPEGLNIHKSKKILRLNKLLYGLKTNAIFVVYVDNILIASNPKFWLVDTDEHLITHEVKM